MTETNFNRTLIGLPFLAAALVLLVASFSGMFSSGGNGRSMQPSHNGGSQGVQVNQTPMNQGVSMSPPVSPSMQMSPQSLMRELPH